MKNNLHRRFLAFLLIFTLLLPIAAEAVPLAVESGEITESATSGSTEVQLPEAVSVAELTQGTQILRHVDEEVLAANQHILRLPSEEKLNSYAFLNRDGSMTVYYLDKAVKYVDDAGEIVEKNISLTKTLGGYTTVTNDMGLLIPDDPAQGINMSYAGYSVTLVPMGGVLRNVAQNDGESITYPNYYGGGASLKYTPSLDGLKEDIVLSRYSGVNTYTFRLFTDGLRMYQDNGRYYLSESVDAEMRISLGEVVAFDAKGRFSVGSMTVETVEMGQEYILTLSIDKKFLTSLTTTYPVSIDPTLQISDNTHSAGAIEDISLYSGAKNANCDWPYLHCGYYDSTYKIARTLFRLSGLLEDSTYQDLDASAINSVKFYIREATGSAGIPVYIHANTGSETWTETGATWNNAGYVIGTRYATASPGLDQFAEYDITSLVKAWKRDDESAEAGFIMVSSNETSVDKAFCGSETATTSRRPYVVVDYDAGTDFNGAIALSLGQSVPVSITASGQMRYFAYTPNNTGFYTFASSNITGGSQIWLYNPSQIQLTNEYHTTANVNLTYHLIAWQTYYIVASGYLSSQSSYNLTATYSPLAVPPAADTITTLNAGYVTTDTAYESKYFKFVPVVDSTYVFQSCNSTGDPHIWLYNSGLMPWGLNDDDGEGNNFRLQVTLEAGQTYYLAVGHFGTATGDVEVAVFMRTQIIEYNYNIKNADSGLIVDVQSSAVGTKAKQNTMHSNTQGHWKIKQETEGTYTIQSQYGNHYYLGISSSEVGQDNVILAATDGPNTRWNIYETADHKLLFEPNSAWGKVLYIPDDNSGTELQLAWASLTDQACQWYIGGYNSFQHFQVPSRTIVLQCDGDLANEDPWYTLIETAVNNWNNSDAGVHIQLTKNPPNDPTNNPSKYTLVVEADKENLYANKHFALGLTTFYGEAGPGQEHDKIYDGIHAGVIIQISQELIDIEIGEDTQARTSIIAHEIGHLFGLEDYNEKIGNDGSLVDVDDNLWLGNNSLMSYGREKENIISPTTFDIRNILFLYE